MSISGSFMTASVGAESASKNGPTVCLIAWKLNTTHQIFHADICNFESCLTILLQLDGSILWSWLLWWHNMLNGMNFFHMNSQALTILQSLAANVAGDHCRLKMNVSDVSVYVALYSTGVRALCAVKDTTVLAHPDQLIHLIWKMTIKTV